MPTSLRWRLPVSYSIVALVAVATLGAVLLLSLNRYYRAQERQFLLQNAQAIAETLETVLQAPEGRAKDTALLQSLVDTSAYLSQTELTLQGPDGAVLATSGDPRQLQAVATLSLQVALEDGQQTIGQRLDPAGPASSFVVVERPGSRFESQTTVRGAGSSGRPAGQVAALLQPAAWVDANENAARSRLAVSYGLAAVDGRSLGTLRLSNGPGFGQAVLGAVTVALGAAALVAGLLAATAGWLASRQLTGPLLALSATARHMAAGDFSSRSAVAREDEIGALAQAFNLMAGRVEQTVSTLRDFVADAAHELHTPLTVLRTELELAGQPGGVAHHHVTAALDQVRRFERLTEDLLDLSRLESGAGPAVRQIVDLAALVRQRSEPAAARAEQSGLELALDVDDGPLPVVGNPAQLARAIDNLLDNALKFTPAPGTVIIGLRRELGEIVLVVEDTGIGLPAGDEARLFRRFHRGHGTAGYPGSGLGLAIVRAVADGHGGQVALGRPAQGTRATLRLPAADGTAGSR